jgi:nucleoside-diphosphate-sugar epimerase
LSGYRNRTEEDVPPLKNFHYASTKKDAEDWLRNFTAETNLPITIVQPANVFGPYDRTFFIKFAEAIEKKMMTYINGGKAWTCPTYIENLADALWLAATKDEAIGETFIISDGLEINWKQFIEKICQELQVSKPRLSINFYIAYRMAILMEGIYKLLRIKTAPAITRYRICNAGRDYHFSIEKAREVLGYSPQVNIDEAIRRTVEWYKKYNRENS